MTMSNSLRHSQLQLKLLCPRDNHDLSFPGCWEDGRGHSLPLYVLHSLSYPLFRFQGIMFQRMNEDEPGSMAWPLLGGQ